MRRILAMTLLQFGAWAALVAGTSSWQTAAAQSQPQAAPQKQIGSVSGRKTSQALIVLNSRSATLSKESLVLGGVQPSAILFADRPVRAAGHLHTKEMVSLWTSGSFAKDPPNATVSIFSNDGATVSDVVVVLRRPRLEGETLTFDVAILEGDIGKADGPASVFIDTIWFGLGSGGVTYLGQNQTTAGTSAAIGMRGDTSTYSGWSNPAPDAPPPVRYMPNYPSLAAPPSMGGGSNAPVCGAPPLLPCY
jgi:hypothetical protein